MEVVVEQGLEQARRPRVRTLHVDDHPLYCVGLRTALCSAMDLELIGEVSSAEAALALARESPIDVALVDVVLPPADGVALTIELLRLQPSCKVLALTMVDEPVRVAQMFRAGAAGYALKSQPPDELLAAIRHVVDGGQYLARSISREDVEHYQLSDEHSPTRLTNREREVFARLIRGESNDNIAAALFISRRTVETHRQHILNKLNARSVVELVRIASRYGIT
jgi:DNA-binding NarL/FixJ family response regulator